MDINRDAKWRGNNRSDEGLTLETSAFLLFTVANLHFVNTKLLAAYT